MNLTIAEMEVVPEITEQTLLLLHVRELRLNVVTGSGVD